MSDNPVLLAEERSEFGKGAARRARRAGKSPRSSTATAPSPVTWTFPATTSSSSSAATRTRSLSSRSTASPSSPSSRTSGHPVRRDILHADFQAVKAGEKVDVEVPVVVTGEPVPGTVHSLEEFAILVKLPPPPSPSTSRSPSKASRPAPPCTSPN